MAGDYDPERLSDVSGSEEPETLGLYLNYDQAANLWLIINTFNQDSTLKVLALKEKLNKETHAKEAIQDTINQLETLIAFGKESLPEVTSILKELHQPPKKPTIITDFRK